MKFLKSAASTGSLFGRLPAVATLVAIAALAPAHAAVIVSPAANITVPATTAGVYINVVSGVSGTTQAAAPGWDVNVWGSSALQFFSNAAAGSAYVANSTSTPPITLQPGATVDASSVYSTTATAVTFGSAAGNWALNSTNYFGFRFIGDDALLHYGYGTLVVGATATTRSIGNLWYESTPGVGITVAVPEASTWAMMLMGGAAVAGLGLRRRKAA